MGTHATSASHTSRERLWIRISDAAGRGQAWTRAAWHIHAWSAHACIGEAQCIGASRAWPVQCTRAQRSVRCMCVDGWCSTCLQTVGVVHACAWPVQCMHVQSGCTACMCNVSAVHVWAWLMQCMHAQDLCSAHMCMASAMCAWLVQCVHGQCSVCLWRMGAVHACAWLVWCVCAQCWCSSCTGTNGAVFTVCSVPACPRWGSTCVHQVSARVCTAGAPVQSASSGVQTGVGEPPHQLTHPLACSEVQRAVPPREVQEGGVFLPLRCGLRRRRVRQ